MKSYYIRKINFLKYEVYHLFREQESFDGYALTRKGARYLAKQIIWNNFIKENNKDIL